MTARSIVTSLAVLLLLPCMVYGQAYEGVSHLLVTGGVTIPTGDFGDYWSIGPQGRLTIRVPVSSAIVFGLQAGIAGPRSEDDYSELTQIPLRAIAYFPTAPEASGTPYIAVGAGLTVNMFGCKGDGAVCSDTTLNYFTYSVALGYTMRPEAMANAFFDFSVRYEQQLINDAADIKTLDFEAGIGLCF